MHWVPDHRSAEPLASGRPLELTFRQSALAWIAAVGILCLVLLLGIEVASWLIGR